MSRWSAWACPPHWDQVGPITVGSLAMLPMKDVLRLVISCGIMPIAVCCACSPALPKVPSVMLRPAWLPCSPMRSRSEPACCSSTCLCVSVSSPLDILSTMLVRLLCISLKPGILLSSESSVSIFCSPRRLLSSSVSDIIFIHFSYSPRWSSGVNSGIWAAV